MKIASLLLLIFGVFVVIGLGFVGLFGFAFAFDAPGSTDDPTVWAIALLFFAPAVILFFVLIFGWIYFAKGNYQRAFWFSSVFGLAIALFVFLTITSSIMSFGSMTQMKHQVFSDEQMRPEEHYFRQVEGGVDTIIIFPGSIVAYRLYTGQENTYNGPVGRLNSTHDTILVDFGIDTLLKKENLSEFLDGQGIRLTDKYGIK